MSRIPEAEVIPKDNFFDKARTENIEPRGRQFKLPLRHEFGSKNIAFKGTVASTANELLRSRSQLSRNSSTHSSTKVATRNNSVTSLPSANTTAAHPSTKTLLAAYNEKTVSDTVLPARHAKLPQIQQAPFNKPAFLVPDSRTSSTHSLLKKNYTFASESVSNIRERQESITGVFGYDNNDYDLEKEVQRRFNKAASISGPVMGRRAHELKKTNLNHSYNATSDESVYSDDGEDEEVQAVGMTQEMSYEHMINSADNLFPKAPASIESTSPKTKPSIELEEAPSGKTTATHDHPMRTLQRQMNIRDQVLSIDNEDSNTNDTAFKWNSLVSLNDKRMFEMITNDLRKIRRYNQKPVAESLTRCIRNNHIKVQNPRVDSMERKFDLSKGKALAEQIWSELNEKKDKSASPTEPTFE